MSFGRVLAAMLLGCAVPIHSMANPIVIVNNQGSSSQHEITVAPGDFFEIDINLDTDTSLFRVDWKIAADTPGIFTITDGSYLPPNIFSNPIPLGGLDPFSDIFIWQTGPPAMFGPGFSTMATITVAVHTSAPIGDYTLNVVEGVFVDCLLCDVEPSPVDIGPDYFVHVVPEPSTLTLAALAIVGLVAHGHRRRRA